MIRETIVIGKTSDTLKDQLKSLLQNTICETMKLKKEKVLVY